MVSIRQKLICFSAALHDLVLGQTCSGLGTLHNIAVALVGVAHIGQAQGPASVLVTSEFFCEM